jgi:hypothetical protein
MMKIIPVSGGFDSVLLLHNVLKSGESCVAHHVHLITDKGSGRYAPEAKAYRAVREELKRMHGDFLHSTSTHKYFNKSWICWDLLNATFHAAVATEGHMRILGDRDLELCLAIPKEEVRYNTEHSILQDRVEDLWEAFFRHRGIKTSVSYPISHLTKHEILEALPENLRKLCWTCRTPVNGVEPCGKCPSCKKVEGKI